MVVYGIEFSLFGIADVISLKLASTTLWGLSFINGPRVHHYEKGTKIRSHNRGKHLDGILIYKFYVQTLPERQRIEGGYVVLDVLLNVLLCDSIFPFSKQGLNNERYNDANYLALELATSTHYMHALGV